MVDRIEQVVDLLDCLDVRLERLGVRRKAFGDGVDSLDSLVDGDVELGEVVDDALEQEAVRRMESGDLTDEEVERLGEQLKRLNEEIDRLKREEGIDESVDAFRGELGDLVADALTQLHRTTDEHE